MGVRPWYTCRVLRWRDAAFCYRLACDPTVREWSRDKSRPTWWRHLRWMVKWMRDPKAKRRRAWVIQVQWPTARPSWESVGLLRAERMEDGRPGSEISIAIAANERGKGAATGQLFDMTPLISTMFDGPVYAFMELNHEASINAFKRAGYRRRHGETEYGANATMAKYWWHRGLKT